MYVGSPSRTYQAKGGSPRNLPHHLLRRSFREDGKMSEEKLAPALPDSAIAALKASLSRRCWWTRAIYSSGLCRVGMSRRRT